jgi:hypothetical protein
MKSQWEDIGTWLQLTVACAHNQNGVVERTIRTIVDHTVSILSDARMPDCLWYEICLTITYLGNLLPHSYLRNDDAPTPSEAFTGKKPNPSHIRAIGSKAHVLVSKEVREHKFKPRAVIGRLVGYDGVHQYRMWAPEMNAIVWGRNITLEEDGVVYEKSRTSWLRLTISKKRGEISTENSTVNQPPWQQEGHHQLDTTVNDLVDQFGDTGVEGGEFPPVTALPPLLVNYNLEITLSERESHHRKFSTVLFTTTRSLS